MYLTAHIKELQNALPLAHQSGDDLGDFDKLYDYR